MLLVILWEDVWLCYENASPTSYGNVCGLLLENLSIYLRKHFSLLWEYHFSLLQKDTSVFYNKIFFGLLHTDLLVFYERRQLCSFYNKACWCHKKVCFACMFDLLVLYACASCYSLRRTPAMLGECISDFFQKFCGRPFKLICKEKIF